MTPEQKEQLEAWTLLMLHAAGDIGLPLTALHTNIKLAAGMAHLTQEQLSASLTYLQTHALSERMPKITASYRITDAGRRFLAERGLIPPG